MSSAKQDTADFQTLGNTFNLLLKWNREREESWTDRLPQNGQLFHYTTVEGLKGIIENNELWASSAYFMIDSSEVTYGCGVIKETLEEWIKLCELDEYSVPLGMAHGLLSSFGRDRLNKNVIDPIYLACFCEDGNLLSQWRAYGQTGGYALAFNFFPVPGITKLQPEPVTYTSRLIKVEYDRAKQLERCRTIIRETLQMFQGAEVAEAMQRISSAYPNRRDLNAYAVISDILMEEAVGFKDKAFAVEKEWRLVVRRRELLKQGNDDRGATPLAIHFRPARGLLIPYVKLLPIPKGTKIPLELIRSGPTIDKFSAFLSLRYFLDKHGFEKAGTKESGITARF